jgi:hypothetical protein
MGLVLLFGVWLRSVDASVGVLGRERFVAGVAIWAKANILVLRTKRFEAVPA